MVLEKTLESPLDCKEIKPVNPKGNHSWIFIGRTDAEAETLIIWAPDMKDWLTGKDPDTEKDWRQEEKGKTEHEIIGWHHRLDGHEFEQAPRTGGAWWAAVYGVAQSGTRLKWLSSSSSSKSWWWTGKHDVLQSMGLQRVRHDRATKQINCNIVRFQVDINYSLP